MNIISVLSSNPYLRQFNKPYDARTWNFGMRHSTDNCGRDKIIRLAYKTAANKKARNEKMSSETFRYRLSYLKS